MDKNAFLIDLCNSERTDFGRVEFAEQSEPQKVFSAIWELESQVNNGGFDQYFRNSDSDLIAYAPAALLTIGAAFCCDIVERAIEVIAPLPPTKAGRFDALEALGEAGEEQLESLDAEFFVYPDELTELLFHYVSKHPEVFGAIPSDIPA